MIRLQQLYLGQHAAVDAAVDVLDASADGLRQELLAPR